jgi:hypothetical protein
MFVNVLGQVYYTPNCAISAKGKIKIVKCNDDGFVDSKHFNKDTILDYDLFTLLLSLTTKTGCFGIQYYCKFDSNCILGDKNRWITMQSNKNFPKESIERDVNIEHIIDMYKVIQSLPKDNFDEMKRLLQKYAWACQRNYSDSAIDLRTLCESIFLNEAYSNEGSITHLVSERGALLLKDTYDERLEVNKLFKSFYGVASKYVHGNNNPKKSDEETIDNANNLIELALERLIYHGKHFDKEYWDKLIFGYKEQEMKT